MSLPANLTPIADDPPPPESTSLHSLLLALFLAQTETIQVLAARLDTLEASQSSLRQDLHALGERLSDLSEDAQAVQSFGWDYVALAQRLSDIEGMLAPEPPATSSSNTSPEPQRPATPLPDH